MTHPLIILIYSRTEDGGTYTNHRAAVLDGNMIIVTHTPATLAESIIISKISGLYLIKEPGSLIKLLSNLLLIVCITTSIVVLTDCLTWTSVANQAHGMDFTCLANHIQGAPPTREAPPEC